jgi:signal transduction histidine kinase
MWGGHVVFVVAVAMVASALSVQVAVLSWRFSMAPGWSDQRWFSLIGITAALFSACNGPIVLASEPAVVLFFSRLQVMAGLLHLASWLRYASAYLRERPSTPERALTALLLMLALAALVPGAVYGDVIYLQAYAPLGVVYRVPEITRLGEVVLAVVLGTFLVVGFRFAQGARRGIRHASIHLAALLVLLCLAANDALAGVGLLTSPYLLDLGYVVPVATVGYVLTARFIADARDLAEIRRRLEALVEERTQALVATQEALHRSEKLAALGQLAAGVAHEVSTPAGVVAANLGFLGSNLEGGILPEEALDCVRESSAAVERIASIAHQLLDAGQIAATRAPLQPISVVEVARGALRTARHRCPENVQLSQEVPSELWAVGHEHLLHQVLVNLVVNGAQAVTGQRPGRVEIRARGGDGKVAITVADDGEGMPPEVLRRVFEPFFTTKPFGQGHGLGLAVSRGLITSLGGDLRIESQPGRGTRAVVELPEAGRPEPR